MRKILVISNTSFSIEKFREHYLSKINDYKFIIYTPNKKPVLKKSYKNIQLKTFKAKNIYEDFKALYKILKNAGKNLIVYSYKYQFIVCMLNKLYNLNLNITSVIAGRGSLNLGNFFKQILYNFIIITIIKHSKVIVCINPDDLIFYKKYSKDKNKFFFIPTEGVEKQPFRKKKNKKKNFIFFGRLINEKGIREYIEAAKFLKKKYPDKNFYIAGPTNQSIIGQSKFSKNTLKLINENKNYIKYLGYVKNYKNIFPKMDCLVSPSYSEGAGTSVMEAMLSGLFIVAYSNSGHDYVLSNTQNKVTKYNTIDELIKKIEEYLNLKNNVIEKINKQSFNKIISNFSSNIVSNKFNQILNTEHKIIKRGIDIIWPYYKDKKFLNKAISLINKQTLLPRRLIFIDDANNEPLLKKQIREKLNRNIKFKYVKNKINYGVTKSISIGIKHVKSKYLYIQSTDDIIYNNFLETNVRILEKNNNAAYVFSNILINNLDNKRKYFINFSFLDEGYTTKNKIPNLYNNYQFKIYHNTVVFNSSKILKFNIFKNQYGRRADMLNLQYLSMRYGFCYLNNSISEFTIRRDQISSSILSNDYLVRELKYIKLKKRKFYNFIIKNNLFYEISPFTLIKSKAIFGNLITLKYLSRSAKFKIWKLFRFYINPSLLNMLFKIFN